jgi:predicted HNH restriction endonuclease
VFFTVLLDEYMSRYADNRKNNIIAVTKRRKKLRRMAVDFLGGKCVVCGYCRDIKVLDFHHINESTKEFGLSDRGMTRSWEKILSEVKKCVLVCANCHREIHSGTLKLAQDGINLVK